MCKRRTLWNKSERTSEGRPESEAVKEKKETKYGVRTDSHSERRKRERILRQT